MRLFIALFALLAVSLGARADHLPDVPGAINPDVTQANIGQTICVPGWTQTVRPPVSMTNRIKRAKLAGMKDRNPAHYELDHLISLQLGGATADPQNLWLQSYANPCGARIKDRLESALKRLVCAGRLSLAQAQQEIRSDWIASYGRWIGPPGCPVGESP